MMLSVENAVYGKRYVIDSPRGMPVFNPATGEQSAELPLSGAVYTFPSNE